MSGPGTPRPSISRRSFLKLFGLALLASSCQPRELPAPSLSATALPITWTPTPFQPRVSEIASPTPLTATPSPSPAPVPTQAPEPYFLIDGHVDIAWNALEFNRKPLLSAQDTRQVEQGSAIPSMVGERTTGFPDWRAGGFGILFATIFVIPAANAYPGYTRMAYSTPEEAAQAGQQELDFYHLLTSQDSSIKLITTRQDLSALKAERQAGKQTIGLVLVMEGADPISDPSDLQTWYDSGLRIIGPAWHATRYAGGTGSPGPLTDLGYRLLDEMASLNMILDLSHISEQAFYQAVEAYPGTIIASHSNPRHFVDGDRFLSDDMIRQIARREGVIGVSLYNAHLQPGWRRGNARPSLSQVADVIDYIVQVAGIPDVVALGTDLDGGFGVDSVPQEIDTAADVRNIGVLLSGMGYSPGGVSSILMGNWLKVLESSLPNI